MGPEYEGPVTIESPREGVYIVRPAPVPPPAEEQLDTTGLTADDAAPDEGAGIGDEAAHTDEEAAEEWLDSVTYYASKIDESGALEDEWDTLPGVTDTHPSTSVDAEDGTDVE
jgi:hypothetical protein